MPSSHLRQSFGQAIRNQRIEQAISQEELAERAGLHRTYVSDVERGVRNLSLGSIERLAQALNVTVAFLFSQVPTEAGATPIDLMVVDSDRRGLESTLQMLRDSRIANTVHTAEDGTAALDLLFSPTNFIRTRIGLILLSVQLAKIDGPEVARRIKADQRTQGIPVVFLANANSIPEPAECRRVGAAFALARPITANDLLRTTSQFGIECVLRGSGVVGK